jgi:hypothetical protein
MKGRGLGLLKGLSRHLIGGTEESHKKHQSGGRDLNPGSSDYETGVVTTLPQCSVIHNITLDTATTLLSVI